MVYREGKRDKNWHTSAHNDYLCDAFQGQLVHKVYFIGFIQVFILPIWITTKYMVSTKKPPLSLTASPLSQ